MEQQGHDHKYNNLLLTSILYSFETYLYRGVFKKNFDIRVERKN